MSEIRKTSGARKILTEPLSVFVLVAVAIFAYDAGFGGAEDGGAQASGIASSSEADVVVIDDTIIAVLQENFAWLEGRQPTEEETRTLINHWVDEEILFREALAQRMHLSDGKMRAHLVEKVRMLWAGSPQTTDDADLLNFYMENMEEYYTEESISFTQVYFQVMPENAADILQRLRAGEEIEGDAYWLGNNLNSYSESILRTSFGGEFYEELLVAPPAEWIGPLESARGYHFARVTEVGEPELLPYQVVRERLDQDWADYQRRQNVSARTEDIKERFTIVMETNGG